jgi:hypothetical protein
MSNTVEKCPAQRTPRTLAVEAVLREGRLPIGEIANLMGMSRQRVSQIKKRIDRAERRLIFQTFKTPDGWLVGVRPSPVLPAKQQNDQAALSHNVTKVQFETLNVPTIPLSSPAALCIGVPGTSTQTALCNVDKSLKVGLSMHS